MPGNISFFGIEQIFLNKKRTNKSSNFYLSGKAKMSGDTLNLEHKDNTFLSISIFDEQKICSSPLSVILVIS